MHDDRRAQVREHLSRDPRRALAILLRENSGQGGAEDFYLLGVAHFRLGEYPPAEDALRKAISLDSTRADTFYYLGLSLERQLRTNEATGAYRTAATLDPNLAKAQEKLRLLDPSFASGSAPRAAPSRPARTIPKDSELILPETDEEFAEYEWRIRRKNMIDTRAGYSAQLGGLPGWTKALIWVVAAFILAVGGSQVYSRLVSGRHGDEQINQIRQAQCEAASRQGVDLPGC